MGHAGWEFSLRRFLLPECHPNLWAETSKNELCNLEAIARVSALGPIAVWLRLPVQHVWSEIEKIRLVPGLTQPTLILFWVGTAVRLLEGGP